MKPPPICLFMTSLPITIAPDTTVLAASEKMRELKSATCQSSTISGWSASSATPTSS